MAADTRTPTLDTWTPFPPQKDCVRALTGKPRRASLFKIQRTVRAKELVCTGGAPRREGGSYSRVTALQVARPSKSEALKTVYALNKGGNK